ncbi:MAG: hypothetical protein IKP95_04970 [Ruminococcus sp.]|nr:hypothetical protein [Ruminococcus sp.]
MKIRKLFAGMAAMAVAATMSISAMALDFTEEKSAGISMQFDTDVSSVAEWEDTSASITNFELGTAFDITLDLGDGVGKPANYFSIETGLAGDDKEEKKNDDGTDTFKYEIKVNSIKADGNDVTFDASGLDTHIEGGKYRCEFYKDPSWGGVAKAVDTSAFPEFSKLVINVTINEKAPAQTAAEEPAAEEPKTDAPADTAPTQTGAAEGIALAFVALAGTALVVSKKK